MFEVDRMIGTALAMALSLSGCGDHSEPASASAPDSGELHDAGTKPSFLWVGAVKDTDVRVAVLVGTGKARLYFCGGADSYATATRWFNIPFDGGEHVEFQEENWRVHVHLIGGGVSGEVELGDGVTRMVSATVVRPGTLAGLYEGKADCGRVGLIVSQENEDAMPMAQGACADPMDKPAQQVNPIAPISSEDGKIRVHAPSGGDATLLLQAATLDAL